MEILQKKLFIQRLALALTAIIVGCWIIPCLLKWQISKKVAISSEVNPQFFHVWQQPPFPSYLKIYLFNITNPEAVQAGLKPKLEAVGPYTFLEFRKKINLSQDCTLDTVTYNEQHVYNYFPALSRNWSLNDNVTMLNIPLRIANALAGKKEKQVEGLLLNTVNMILLNSKEPMLVTTSVNQALFQGWEVPFLNGTKTDFSLVEESKFGFFLGKNNSVQGSYTIQTGIKGDKSLFGNMISFKGNKSLQYWGDSDVTCNKISGTDGTIFPPNLNRGKVIRAFRPELCRSLYLTYEKDITYEGLAGYRFSVPLGLFEDPRISEENRCFCKNIENDPESCLGKGALDLRPCQHGAPIALTFPHFLQADPKYFELIEEGMNPDNNSHKSYIDIEPITGMMLQSYKRFQLNLIVKQVSGSKKIEAKENMLFPLYWTEESFKLHPMAVEQLQINLYWHWFTQAACRWVSLLFAFFLLFPLLFLQKKIKETSFKEVRISSETGSVLIEQTLSDSTASSECKPLKTQEKS